MRDDLEDIRQRQHMLEARVGTLEVTVKTEAELRAAMDNDMGSLKAEFRAQRTLLQAMADTQSEHTARLTRLGARVDTLGAKVDTLEAKVDTLEAKVDIVQAGVQTIVGLLDKHIDSDI